MTFNPFNLFILKDRFQLFKKDHPDVSAYGKALRKHAIVKGTVLEIKATTPEGKVLKHEIVLTDNDVETVKTFFGGR